MLCGGKDTTFFCRTCPLLAAVGRNTRLFDEKSVEFSAKTPSFWGKVQGDDRRAAEGGWKRVGFIGGNSAAQ